MKTIKYTVTVEIEGPEADFESVNADLSSKLQADIWLYGKDLGTGLKLRRAEVSFSWDS